MKNACFRLPPVYGVGPHDSLYVNGERKKSGLKIFIDNASVGQTPHTSAYEQQEINLLIPFLRQYSSALIVPMYKHEGIDIKDYLNAYNYYQNLITLPLHSLTLHPCLRNSSTV